MINRNDALPSEVISIIENRKHFTFNEVVMKFVQPVVDSIGRLEKRTSSLADCYLEIIRLCYRIYSLRIPGQEHFRSHVIRVLNKRSAEFLKDDIYLLALFLHPKCRGLAFSGQNNLMNIMNRATKYAKDLGWSESASRILLTNIHQYRFGQGIFSFGLSQYDPVVYWDLVGGDASNNTLKYMARLIFKIVPQAADVERIFSTLVLQNTKLRNRMEVSTLKMMGTLKLHFQQQRKTTTSDEHNLRKIYGLEDSNDETEDDVDECLVLEMYWKII